MVCHYWQAVGTLVLSASGRGVVRAEAHGRCVLVRAVDFDYELLFFNHVHVFGHDAMSNALRRFRVMNISRV